MRIDSLNPGSIVTLRFHGRFGNATLDETWTFERIDGKGDARRAVFSSYGPNDTWESYRMAGRWCYGSSAERLQLIAVLD